MLVVEAASKDIRARLKDDPWIQMEILSTTAVESRVLCLGQLG